MGAPLFLFPNLIRAAENSSSARATQIDELVSRYQKCGFLNGAVLVAEHGKVLSAKGVGEANMRVHTPNTCHTRFGIASITKQFTAVLVLQEVAKGHLRLNGTVSEYLPWYRKDTGSQITVEQLLHHTSGLPPDYDSPAFSDGAEAKQPREALAFAQKFCQPDLIASPGTKWAYSNGGYVLLGLILEHVSGKSFSKLLNEQILIPVGMKNTGIAGHNLREIDGAIGYTRHAGPRYTPGPELDAGHIFSAGAMYSTAEDLFLWNQALSSGVLLPPELQRQLFEPGLRNWAYGWFVTKIPEGAPGAGSTLAEMRGDMPGNFFTWTLRYPEQDRIVIVLRNGYGSTEHFEENLQTLLFGGQPHMPRRNAKDIFAHSALVIYGWSSSHVTLTTLILLFAIASGWYFRKRHRTSPAQDQPLFRVGETRRSLIKRGA
jgi:CubicO group peptidase (beta-lactamase class C family)